MAKWRSGINCKMKKLIFSFLIILLSQTSIAKQMQGFAENYYSEDYYNQNETKKEINLEILLNESVIKFESNTLIEIGKKTSRNVEHDNESSWLCLKDKTNTDYWFISDNEMGGGYLTAVVIAKNKQNSGCDIYHGQITILAKDGLLPLLDAKAEDIKTFYKTDWKIPTLVLSFYKDTPVGVEYYQGNLVQYYIKENKIKGMIISQITSN